MSSTRLWVKGEVFQYGTLPVPPHPRVTFHNIKKIIAYTKSKSKSGTSRLSYPVWKHIACNKLQLPEDVAWMYFVNYDLVSNQNQAGRLQRDDQFSQCESKADLEHVRNQLAVNLLEFVLFLFIQHLHKTSVKASLLAVTDEWSHPSKSPDLDTSRSTIGAKGLDERTHLSFVQTNLKDMMALVADIDLNNNGAESSDITISTEAVQALGLIIEGSLDSERSVKSLLEITRVHPKSEFNFHQLHFWLRSNLGPNPFGISSCIANGRRLSWPMASWKQESGAVTTKGRIATNALLVPKEHIKGNKLIIMSQVSKQTIARSSATLEDSAVKIHRCHFSFIYLLSPLRSVSIEKCRHSTIVLGPVETFIHMTNCEQVTLITACRRISIALCTDCSLYLLTPNQPIILPGNMNITLAPYHTYYPLLDEHLNQTEMKTKPNLWDKPLCLALDQQENSWQILAPKDFFGFVVPFEMVGDTEEIPGGLPLDYQRALREQSKQIDLYRAMVKKAGLNREQRKLFQEIVENKFQEWLQEAGYKEQLDGLVLPPNNETFNS